jgi:hypothetical protein
MPSNLQSETSRQNGAKSHGPVTAAGQARSSQNALRHGLTAAVVVLPHESQEEFNQLLKHYIHDFRPATRSQQDLVETLAATRWRTNRLVAMESRLFEQELARNLEAINQEFAGVDDTGKMAFALDKMVNTSKTPAHLLRYESQLNRTYDRALKHLKDLQSMQSAAPSLAKPNRDSNGAAIPNTPNHLPEVPNEPGEPSFSPQHPPETPPSDRQNSEEGDEILAA